MVQLVVTDPQHPHADWTSSGQGVHIAVDCNCAAGAGQQACLNNCQASAERLLAAAVHALPED